MTAAAWQHEHGPPCHSAPHAGASPCWKNRVAPNALYKNAHQGAHYLALFPHQVTFVSVAFAFAFSYITSYRKTTTSSLRHRTLPVEIFSMSVILSFFFISMFAVIAFSSVREYGRAKPETCTQTR
jgi:hypothetical protein